MSLQKTGITESEYEIMKVLWDSKRPLTVSEVRKGVIDRDWKNTTVSTLLTRLAEKGAVGFEARGKVHYYYPVLKEEEYNLRETKSLLSKIYGGSVRNLVASLYENKEISSDEIDDLKKMFELE